MKLVHWPMMDGLLYLVQRRRYWVGIRVGVKAPPRCTKCITAHQSTASVPITVLLYNDPLLCGFSVAVKGLIESR